MEGVAMDNIGKPIAMMRCTADLRSDRCPAKIRGNAHDTVLSACLHCEHGRVTHCARGSVIAEIGGKAADETKEYREQQGAN